MSFSSSSSRKGRQANDAFPDVSQLAPPQDCYSSADEDPLHRDDTSSCTTEERQHIGFKTAQRYIEMGCGDNRDLAAQAHKRLQAFIADGTCDKGAYAETKNDDTIHIPFDGDDWNPMDDDVEEEIEPQRQQQRAPLKKRRVTTRERLGRATLQPDRSLSYVRMKFIEPAADHIQHQVSFKQRGVAIPDPSTTNTQRRAMRQRPDRELRVEWVQNILDNLDNFFPRDKPRTTVQCACHYWYLQTTFKWIFGKQWDVMRPRILARYKLERVWPWVMVLMPRREGKTWSVASFIAAVLLFIPGIKLSIFSPTSAQSNMMKDEVYRMMVHYEVNTGKPTIARLVRYNTRNIMVANRPIPLGKSINSSEADAMSRETSTSILMLCNSNIDGKCVEEMLVWAGKCSF